MATRDPLADLQQIGQQYWQGLQDMGQQFLKQNPAPAAPWAEGMEQWRSMYQGDDSGGVLGNLLSQGKTWISTLEQLFKSGASGAGSDLSALLRQSLEQFRGSQPWMEGLGQSRSWFDPAQLQQWVSSLSGQSLPGQHAPSFGFNREQQERLTQLGDDLAAYQRETQRYQALINKAMEAAIGRMEHKLAELDEPGRQLKTLKSVYDLWIDALEESYAEIALSPEFRDAYGALVNSQMRVRQGIQTQVERSSAALGMPTRSELDGVHRKVADLRRAMRQTDQAPRVHPDEFENLRAEIVELKRELAGIKAAGRKAEMVVATRPKPSANPSPSGTASKTAPAAAQPVAASKTSKPAASRPAAKTVAKSVAKPATPAAKTATKRKRATP